MEPESLVNRWDGERGRIFRWESGRGVLANCRAVLCPQ